jgi:N-acetylneuraminic acid mutarotase
MPTARNHVGVGVVNNKVYVVGGRVGAAWITMASNTDVVEEYDSAADKWSSLRARMPTARSGGASAVWNGRVLYAGGEFQDARMMGAFRALEAYDPVTNTWALLPSMPLPRHGVAGAVIGNRFHLVSGDLQSAGTGHDMHTNAHDVFEFDGSAK